MNKIFHKSNDSSDKLGLNEQSYSVETACIQILHVSTTEMLSVICKCNPVTSVTFKHIYAIKFVDILEELDILPQKTSIERMNMNCLITPESFEKTISVSSKQLPIQQIF